MDTPPTADALVERLEALAKDKVQLEALQVQLEAKLAAFGLGGSGVWGQCLDASLNATALAQIRGWLPWRDIALLRFRVVRSGAGGDIWPALCAAALEEHAYLTLPTLPSPPPMDEGMWWRNHFMLCMHERSPGHRWRRLTAEKTVFVDKARRGLAELPTRFPELAAQAGLPCAPPRFFDATSPGVQLEVLVFRERWGDAKTGSAPLAEVQRLLIAGADPNMFISDESDSVVYSLLHYAARYCRNDLVEALLAAGALVNARGTSSGCMERGEPDESRRTPYDLLLAKTMDGAPISDESVGGIVTTEEARRETAALLSLHGAMGHRDIERIAREEVHIKVTVAALDEKAQREHTNTCFAGGEQACLAFTALMGSPDFRRDWPDEDADVAYIEG
jgi:hypothetical protein